MHIHASAIYWFMMSIEGKGSVCALAECHTLIDIILHGCMPTSGFEKSQIACIYNVGVWVLY